LNFLRICLDVTACVQVLSRLARLTPHTTSGVSGAVIELQRNTLRACDATVDLVLQALQPVTFLPHGVDWYVSSRWLPCNRHFVIFVTRPQEELVESRPLCCAPAKTSIGNRPQLMLLFLRLKLRPFSLVVSQS
jgi:hypothetical protein